MYKLRSPVLFHNQEYSTKRYEPIDFISIFAILVKEKYDRNKDEQKRQRYCTLRCILH